MRTSTSPRGFVNLNLFASSDETMSLGDTLLATLSRRKLKLMPGKSVTFKVPFKVPADVTAGAYYLIAEAEPDLRLSFLELIDTNLANNVAVTTTPIDIE